MRRWIRWNSVLAASLCLLSGCATTQTLPARHLDLSVAPSSGMNGDALVQELSDLRPDWTIGLRQDRGQRMNAIRSDDGGLSICLSPDRIYEEDTTVAYLPMMCGTLSADHAAHDLIALVEAQTRSFMEADALTDMEILNLVLESSSASPLCFSILPLWLSDRQMFVTDHVVAENYMITCARNIRQNTGETQSYAFAPSEMAAWLEMASSVLTSQTDFIRRAFMAAIDGADEETRVLAQGMEAHVELKAGKWTQAQLTLISALNDSEHTDIDWLSDILAMKMYQALYSAPSLSPEVFEEVVPALYPRDGSFDRLTYRYALLTRTCRMAVLLPDVTPQIVESCLPAMDIVFSDMPEADHYDYVFLMERAVSDKRHPFLTTQTLNWLREHCEDGSCRWFPELRRTAFATPNLTQETRRFFEEFTPISKDAL